MYIPPIILTQRQIEDEIIKHTDDTIMYEVQHRLMIDIDKEELIKALNYDRDQYNEGFADGHKAGYRQALEEMGMINDNDTSI